MAPAGKPELPRELAGGDLLHALYSGCSTARLYAAAVRAATELGFAITARDDAGTTLSFRLDGPTSAWPGEEMTAAIRTQGYSAQIVVGGARTVAYRPGVADWRQAKTIGLMFLDRLSAVLPGVPESGPDATSGRSTADRLESLGELRDRGLLTEDEFAAAKKLLS